MLDGLLGRGFFSKCKSLIKLTKSRIEVIRRKRNAALKFLKKDIADLLANGLDINAYGRADGFIAELTLSYCYDFVEQSCDFVLKHLSVMQKLRHCPEDCREAVSSLMFAAARFSDLPELRDLRDMFYERYGNSVELFVNQEFVEKMSSKSVTTEKKVQLMRDIASEFSLKWDSRACEQMMSKSSAAAQDQPKTYAFFNINDDKKSINGKDAVPKGYQHDVLSKERLNHNYDGYRFINDKESNVLKTNGLIVPSGHEVPNNGYKPPNVREETLPKRDNRDIWFQGRQEAMVEKHQPWKEDTPLKTVRLGGSSQRKRIESVDGGSKPLDGRENTVSKRDGQEALSHGKPYSAPNYVGLWSKSDGEGSLAAKSFGGQGNIAISMREVQEEINELKPYHNNAIPPPYTKPNGKPKDGKYGASSDGTVVSKIPSMDAKANAGNRSEKVQQGAYHADHEGQNAGLTKENGDGRENYNHSQGNVISNTIPKPRSIRRRHSKSHSSHDDIGTLEDTGVVKRRSRSRRRDDSRRGLQILFDDDHYQNDEEERMIDRLLMHYSKKPSAYEHGKVRRKSKSRHAHHQNTEADKYPQQINRDGPDEISDMGPPPPRSISLPREQTAPSQDKKMFTRAASFQPDRSSPARHVHPKLPDYDDLAARFAALKGR